MSRTEIALENELKLHTFIPSESADEPPCCDCGDWYDSGPSKARIMANFHQHQTQAVLAALKAARIELVELPEPDDVGSGQDGEFDAWWGHYPNNDASHPSKWPNHDIAAEGGDVHWGALQMRPEKARAMALALLAAAAVGARITVEEA